MYMYYTLYKYNLSSVVFPKLSTNSVQQSLHLFAKLSQVPTRQDSVQIYPGPRPTGTDQTQQEWYFFGKQLNCDCNSVRIEDWLVKTSASLASEKVTFVPLPFLEYSAGTDLISTVKSQLKLARRANRKLVYRILKIDLVKLSQVTAKLD